MCTIATAKVLQNYNCYNVYFYECLLIFHKEIYAMACVIGGLAYWGGVELGVPVGITAIISFVVTCLIRFLAVRYHIAFPILKSEEKSDED